MRRDTLLSATLGLAFVLGTASAALAIPNILHFQSYLAEDDGTPVDDEVNIVFRILDQETGGTPLWGTRSSASR